MSAAINTLPLLLNLYYILLDESWCQTSQTDRTQPGELRSKQRKICWQAPKELLKIDRLRRAVKPELLMVSTLGARPARFSLRILCIALSFLGCLRRSYIFISLLSITNNCSCLVLLLSLID
jgi:hypothetical protein